MSEIFDVVFDNLVRRNVFGLTYIHFLVFKVISFVGNVVYEGVIFKRSRIVYCFCEYASDIFDISFESNRLGKVAAGGIYGLPWFTFVLIKQICHVPEVSAFFEITLTKNFFYVFVCFVCEATIIKITFGVFVN